MGERTPAPRSHAADRFTHALLLAAAVAVPLLGAVMATDPSGRVAFAGLESWPLPTLCPSRWVGFRCPTCGVTRSVIALMHGDLRTSLQMHRFGWLVLALIVTQIPYRMYRVVRPERPLPRLERIGMGAALATAAVIVANRFFEIAGAW